MSADAHNLRFIDAVDRTGAHNLRFIDAVDRTGLYAVLIVNMFILSPWMSTICHPILTLSPIAVNFEDR